MWVSRVVTSSGIRFPDFGAGRCSVYGSRASHIPVSTRLGAIRLARGVPSAPPPRSREADARAGSLSHVYRPHGRTAHLAPVPSGVRKARGAVGRRSPTDRAGGARIRYRRSDPPPAIARVARRPDRCPRLPGSTGVRDHAVVGVGHGCDLFPGVRLPLVARLGVDRGTPGSLVTASGDAGPA